MKTEQEQIEKMARSMCGYCSTDGKCAVSKNGREPDICANVDTQHCLYKEYAERLIESGYGKVSEYEAEIEQLKAKNKVLGDGVAKAFTNGFNTGRKQVEKDIRRAKIDMLNEVKTLIFQKDNPYNVPFEEFISANVFCGYIDELIKEVE